MKLLCIRSRLPILFIFFQKKFSFLLPALFMIDSQATLFTTSTKRPKAYNTIEMIPEFCDPIECTLLLVHP